MKRIAMINATTGSKMLVVEDRKKEYLKAGHKLVGTQYKKTEAEPATKKADSETPENKE